VTLQEVGAQIKAHIGGGPTKHRKEHKGANLFKNTRISATTDHKGLKNTRE